MSDKVSRRNFVKAAGVATGVTIMAGKAPFAYAANEKIRVGCIGTGGQGSFHVRDGLMAAENVTIAAICDVYEPHQRNGALIAQVSNAGVEIVAPGMTEAQKRRVVAAYRPAKYYDYKEMLTKESLDAVVISTPLHTHYQLTMDALEAGCHVFCEKTMCYEIEQARNIVKKCHETGLFVQVGHQRRYNPLYNKAAQMLRDGTIGRVIHIDAQWHRNNDWRRPVSADHKLNPYERKYINDLVKHMNWRLYKETSRGLLTELATHQLDIASWFLDAMPKRVVGMGGQDYWRDGREIDDNINVVYDYEVSTQSRAHFAVNARNAFQDKVKVNDTYNVRLCYSNVTANAQKGCSELIQGDKGTIQLSETGGSLFEEATASVKWGGGGSTSAASAEEAAKIITSGGTLTLSNKAVTAGEPIEINNNRSVDQLQFIRWANDIANAKKGAMPKANQYVGLRATIMALSGYEAIAENKVVEIDPALYTFDFETPDASQIS
jgi:predicted dehydrogenase